VSPQLTFYTGLTGSKSFNPHIITTVLLCGVCSVASLGFFLYGKYYLQKYHKIWNVIKFQDILNIF